MGKKFLALVVVCMLASFASAVQTHMSFECDTVPYTTTDGFRLMQYDTSSGDWSASDGVITGTIVLIERPVGQKVTANLLTKPVQIARLVEALLQIFLVKPPTITRYPRPH